MCYIYTHTTVYTHLYDNNHMFKIKYFLPFNIPSESSIKFFVVYPSINTKSIL